ncbi:MAG: hypothetical protein KatS3mg002_0178 [Candidatus Woesearchaeota archaeon]|nr:MAG: hypothetical protein KatS3mg002_0178 [Candidatus Woesearchaeota archaeon]
MVSINPESFKEFENKYRERIKKEFEEYKKGKSFSTQSRQYQDFKKQWMPKNLTIYEKLCNISESVFKITPDKKEAEELQEYINICHLSVTPSGVKSFSFLGPIVLILVISFFSFLIPFLLSPEPDLNSSIFFVIFVTIAGMVLIIPLSRLPEFLANNWRMSVSNEMVLSIFYIVTYMRHTSNLENAIDFAAEHLPPPLSLDLKKVIWDVETGKYDSIKESLDAYLETWKKWNIEYVESMQLIQSSLYETSESRRLDSLEKSLRLILDETYEKMLHYAHNLQGPLTMLNMLGIVLPILGLVILPLVVSFIEAVKWYHLLVLYDITLPIGVYYLGKIIMSTRPSGYGETDISKNNPEMKKLTNIIIKVGNSDIVLSPFYAAFFLFIVFFLIGISPIIIHSLVPGWDLVVTSDNEIVIIDNYSIENGKFYFLGYRQDGDRYIGPFGLGSAIISLFVPLAFGLSLGVYYSIKSKNIIKIREESKRLENEFAGALFQLGNRIGDGLPIEIAFSKVAEVTAGTTSGRFFELVSLNITKLGMNVESAIFDKKNGALVYYPSNLIESSMKVLVESSKKGPLVASQAVINVSEYIKQIHRVDERLKDLMADTISSLQSQISFLTPAIAGIVIGITSMITTILGSLKDQMSKLSGSLDSNSLNIGNLPNQGFDFFGMGIPTFYFQIIVGIYVVQIIYIMTTIVNGIRNGVDPLNERYLLGKNLKNSILLYTIISFLVMLIFNIIAGLVLSGLVSTTGI